MLMCRGVIAPGENSITTSDNVQTSSTIGYVDHERRNATYESKENQGRLRGVIAKLIVFNATKAQILGNIDVLRGNSTWGKEHHHLRYCPSFIHDRLYRSPKKKINL